MLRNLIACYVNFVIHNSISCCVNNYNLRLRQDENSFRARKNFWILSRASATSVRPNHKRPLNIIKANAIRNLGRAKKRPPFRLMGFIANNNTIYTRSRRISSRFSVIKWLLHSVYNNKRIINIQKHPATWPFRNDFSLLPFPI